MLRHFVGPGPHSLHTAARSTELQHLMKRREWAWLVAGKIVLHWVVVQGAAATARAACTLLAFARGHAGHLLQSTRKMHKAGLHQTDAT